MALKIGDQLPVFELKNQYQEIISNDVFRNKIGVVYFYPKDNTPGCTAQACTFRDAYEELISNEVEVVGISSDSSETHAAFSKKHNLPFHLLEDTNGKTRKKFGVPSNIFGLIPGRVTYVIDQKGTIRGIINAQLKINEHIKRVQELIEEIKQVKTN